MSGIISIRLSYVKRSDKTARSTKEATMFLSLFQTLRQQYQLKQTLVALQRRADDRLLDDIGLTRDDLMKLMHTPPKGDARTVKSARLVTRQA
jgi:uncharacterized protein YjiS (DUF1127 family)